MPPPQKLGKEAMIRADEEEEEEEVEEEDDDDEARHFGNHVL